jgi:hypothetical protein
MVSNSLPDLCELRHASRAQIKASLPGDDARGTVSQSLMLFFYLDQLAILEA